MNPVRYRDDARENKSMKENRIITNVKKYTGRLLSATCI